MYHCKVQFYIFSRQNSFIEMIEQMPTFEHFTHEFTESDSMDEDLAANADVILADLQEAEIKEVLQTLLSCKKEDAELILLADKTQVNQLTEEELSQIEDIWILPLSEKEIKYRFSQWQRRIKQQKDLWETENYLDTTINSVPHLIWYKDKSGAHEKVNWYFCDAVNKTMEQIEGRGHYYIWDITPEEYASGEFICMESEYEVMNKKETCIFEEEVKIRDEMRQLKTYKSPLFDLDGTVMGTVGIATDVTQERIYEQMILNNANTDFLTGLYNRRYISEYIEQEEEAPLVVYYMDLDNFKHVNDAFGHQAGDDALKLTADVLKKTMPEGIIARIGGDEFMVIELGDYTEEGVEAKRKMLQQNLDEAYAQVKELQDISVSVGTAHSKKGKNVMDELVHEADASMYREKMEKKKSRR
jgi:diguanylate cyclase (GGDEF)-like protein/PAS domain S-box-containing protein